jgi:hypothetical protein
MANEGKEVRRSPEEIKRSLHGLMVGWRQEADELRADTLVSMNEGFKNESLAEQLDKCADKLQEVIDGS